MNHLPRPLLKAVVYQNKIWCRYYCVNFDNSFISQSFKSNINMSFYWRLLRLGSLSPQRIFLTRSRSTSLVDIPTFISQSVTLCSIVETTGERDTGPSDQTQVNCKEKHFKLARQQREARKEKKRQWSIMCVAFGFFSSCLVLVGVMLSITSEYQVEQQTPAAAVLTNIV